MMQSPDPHCQLPARPRLLVINVARIGDTLLLTPALRALKETWPDSTLTVWAHRKRMAVLENLPFIDRLQAFFWWRGLIERHTGAQHDVALVYGRDPKCLQAARRCARQVVVFDDMPGTAEDIPGKTLCVKRPAAPVHAVMERLLLAQAIGADTKTLRLAYQVTQQERQQAEAWLHRNGFSVASGQPLVALQLKSFPTKAHRDWPLAHFRQLMMAAHQQWPDMHFLILGDKASATAAGKLASRFADFVTVAANRVSLRESVALMQCCRLYIGVDTGPTHLAGALGLPMIALYHAAYPGQYLMPLQHPALTVIEHPDTGRLAHPEQADMAKIPVQTVLEALAGLIHAHDRPLPPDRVPVQPPAEIFDAHG